MNKTRTVVWQVSPLRGLLEVWLVCLGLLIPLLPVVLDTTRLARSLYLILVPILCALVFGLRLRLPNGSLGSLALKECGQALLLSLGILAIVVGVFAVLGRLDAIETSIAGFRMTVVFLLMAAPEYLAIRLMSWGWQRWSQLRRHHYAWALTHMILTVVGAIGLLCLVGAMVYLANLLGNDIWEIPPDSLFAQIVFWLSIILLLSAFLFTGAIILFLPPAMLFSSLAARKMTARLESLAVATRVLRTGDLSTRAEVKGEDEIAQLQADFNAMATDLENSVQELQAEKDKVWGLMEARRELVAGISHELRNPVAIVLGYSDSLRHGWQELDPAGVERDLETIQYEATRMQTILNDLLTTSQIDTGSLQVTLQAVDVADLVQRLVKTFSHLAWGSKRVQVTLEGPEGEVIVQADPLRLEQVLVNLVQNAVQHSSAGGLVAIEIHPDGDGVCIEVEDTGEGISAEDLPHIWEKYFRASSSQRQTRYGLGLGLSLVKELTEAMGGRVAVESWPGQGSVFRVWLRRGR